MTKYFGPYQIDVVKNIQRLLPECACGSGPRGAYTDEIMLRVRGKTYAICMEHNLLNISYDNLEDATKYVLKMFLIVMRVGKGVTYNV